MGNSQQMKQISRKSGVESSGSKLVTAIAVVWWSVVLIGLAVMVVLLFSGCARYYVVSDGVNVELTDDGIAEYMRWLDWKHDRQIAYACQLGDGEITYEDYARLLIDLEYLDRMKIKHLKVVYSE